MNYLEIVLLCDFIAVNPTSAITFVLNLILFNIQDNCYCLCGGGGVARCRGGGSSGGLDRFACGGVP